MLISQTKMNHEKNSYKWGKKAESYRMQNRDLLRNLSLNDSCQPLVDYYNFALTERIFHDPDFEHWVSK